MKAAVISALSSGQGKTLFTMALLQWLKENVGSVRPFKVGPDYIDPRFHEKITGVASVNLDLYMMSEVEVKNAFSYYTKDFDCTVVEGVMGLYDGLDYGTSTYEVAKAINIPTILIISAEGSYATLVPVLRGILDYKPNNTVQGVILNKVSSEKHYETVAKQINSEIPNLKILGWIQKGLDIITSRHLGLDLTELENEKFSEIANKVMEHINITELMDFMELKLSITSEKDCFMRNIEKHKKTIAVVNDRAFSFVYKQNLDFFDKFFEKVYRISALNNDEIPQDADVVYIPGGYVETPDVAYILDKADKFKSSLKAFSENPKKKIYAECAGFMFLGEKIQTTDGNWINGAGILPVDFEIQKKRNRLGYYKAIDKDDLMLYKGHAFHYSCPTNIEEEAIVKWGLFKDKDSQASVGAWTNEKRNVLGTYLHTLFYNQPELVLKYFIGE
ncbi:MAG: hydrogenobyrinic acid a,c-diamide synthase (glutamine-hydrolyzing) [Candidatus Melainabacteria bacterium GWF2_37_15]|nr:MAG: hydrogenobyrinic acid a,c-diamide synthase (glutamine-hydrolyzing) [Candidatus Melainabacteria bacterium GWF2_37_15]